MEQTPLPMSSEVLDYFREELSVQTCMRSSTLSFMKGFMLGQLSVIVVIVLALRYLLMEDVKRVKKVYIYAYIFGSKNIEQRIFYLKLFSGSILFFLVFYMGNRQLTTKSFFY